MSFRKKFVFVDIHSSALHQWKRVRIEEVKAKLIDPSKNYRCFQSVQLWEKPRREEGELMWMSFFFDLDSDDLNEALSDVKRLMVYLAEQLQITGDYIRVYFSGKKGFHVIVQPEIFDIVPAPDLHLRMKKAALYIAELLKLKSFDHKVYSKRRVLRVYNSIHEDTKLYKIELHHTDIGKGIPHILKMAKRPQKADERPHSGDFTEDTGFVTEAKELWDQFTAEVEEAKELSNLSPDHLIRDFGEFPVCMKHILSLDEQPRPNSGNRTVLSMASYMKDAKKTETEAIAVLSEWAKRQKNIGDSGNPKSAEAMVKATVAYVYRASAKDITYHFACKYILALGTPDNKIPCQGLSCPAIRGKEQQTKEVFDLALSDFSKSVYLGEKVRTKTLISGKAGTPYVVPKRVKFTCYPDEESGFCVGCPIAHIGGEASFEFDVTDNEVLEIINCSSGEQWKAIKTKWRFPATCKRNHGRVEEYMNVEEVRMAPAAIAVNSLEKMEFVARKGYFIGYPITSNKRYTLVGYPVKEPRSQESAFLFTEKKKLETEIETFRLTPEIREELKIFERKDGQMVEDKFREIHTDLSFNVTRIRDRMEMAWAMDILAHSVRGFRFGREPFVKGWVELLIVGDSGQAKSQTATKLLREHYGIGEHISGGSAKRTGLLYSYQETGKKWMLIWGVIPLSDLGLVIIDEFGDLPEDQFALLTDVRSSGIVRATGVVTAETYGRVRLLALTNPKKGKHLAEFDYPCHSIKAIVPAAEDIRRFDFACAVASGEVSVERINIMDEEEVPHVYTSHLCSQLIRWAWSRKDSQVRFLKESVKLILKEATRMSGDFFAGELPLVEPADQRFKIARLSAAVAARVFSTDDTGELLIVKPEHIHFAVELMYYFYTSPNFRYGDWSKNQRRSEGGDEKDLEKSLDEIRKIEKWRRLLGLLSMSGQIESRDFEAIFENRAKSTGVANVLRHLGVVEKKWGKYFKTAKGNMLLKWIIEKKKMTPKELEDAILDSEGKPPSMF